MVSYKKYDSCSETQMWEIQKWNFQYLLRIVLSIFMAYNIHVQKFPSKIDKNENISQFKYC